MKEKITKLIDVKTIVTFAVTGLFCYLAAIGRIEADKVWEAFLIIISFYFGTQYKKKEEEKKEEENKNETDKEE